MNSIQATNNAKVEFIRDKQHIWLFRELLSTAKHSILIETPWVHHEAAEFFIRHIPLLQKRGVVTTVFYGYMGAKSNDNDERLLRQMSRLLGPGRILMFRQGTHEKVLIVDDSIAVIGSWNWLSNSYHKKVRQDGLRHITTPPRREISVLLKGDVVKSIAGEYNQLLSIHDDIRRSA